MRRVVWQLPSSFKAFAEGVHAGHAIRHGVARPVAGAPAPVPESAVEPVVLSSSRVERSGEVAVPVDA
ncbi:hypothetical protein SAMN06297387_101109 [Streptomyces zhaozhouensis]|uniref:Uncharacterized protein n=1 Tax=Streptomyces zhaozhouensis TaxID=1300267 RepID=A0A286DI16_9ACTN|nr:hypothetical protein [Streptomyces zhaozhouensis]SOD58362.1 hypothetical protein SAMN06297387_101109 [Streptomyces zhaozhouensis]